jgi:ribosomal protein L7/L12
MIGQQDYIRLVAQARRDLDGGGDLESVLSMLKENGFSQIDCIRGIIDLTGSSMAEAKETVHLSRAWEATRERSDEFHKSLESGLTEEETA